MALIRSLRGQLTTRNAVKALVSCKGGALSLTQRCMTTEHSYEFETLRVSEPKKWVKEVQLNRPDSRNAMNLAMWRDLRDCFNALATDADCRAVVLSGAGKLYTAGWDLKEAVNTMAKPDLDPGRYAVFISQNIKVFQDAFTSMELCPKPVIAAIHNACLGAGVDMISACDIRFCTKDAWFQIKEIEMGLAADGGTLQRFQKVIGNDSLFRELAYIGRTFKSPEAKEIGFVSRILPDKDAAVAAAIEVAEEISERSPIAIQGTKVNIVYSRDHTAAEGLNFQRAWNSAMLQSEDVAKSVMAAMMKEKVEFEKV